MLGYTAVTPHHQTPETGRLALSAARLILGQQQQSKEANEMRRLDEKLLVPARFDGKGEGGSICEYTPQRR